MKITHAIIKDGISYGIPEGTKVPEKPAILCQYPQCKKKYDRDLQALLSVAIQWEDQEAVMKLVYASDNPQNLCGWRPQEGGIYPLLGVEAETVRLFRYKAVGHSLWLGWVESVMEYDLDVKVSEETKPQTKFVLRLIPQPNSEQKIATADSHLATEIQKRVDGTEVSEPDMGVEAYNLMKEKHFGVDEKKEPEAVMKREVGGVSEEEPTQDALVQEIWDIAEKWMGMMSKGKAEIKSKFYIQKLKK